ncbi:GAF domain-containing protein [Conexibacter sp. CPCC 206217]|uniref:helix-turn-helix domain-containing protein n=1 Tax=Conexibacter sp. CPCC 206217 TaxID=3064574 RepID=UPI0027288F7F|nr:GAF domain-containing protein [Conexibacter sp. CPCC 206217]MDO8210107.1 GAF domain-containing protein [Conexibacter sp. CPCC 206217]
MTVTSDRVEMESTVLFLRLLAEGAPVAAFQEAVASARAAGLSEQASTALRRQLPWALRVHEVIERRRRHEQELQALFETAGDISALRATDAVLLAICRRARSLLRTDAAWINLADPEHGDSYIRATDQTASGPGLRLVSGAGLGGLVTKTGRPQWTLDYVSDHHLHHFDEGDDWVRRAGLRAIVGVPLRRGEEILGVVLAGERSQRRFDHDEIVLLQSLADHAAVAIENARLFEDSQRALAELHAANELVRTHSELIERSVLLHERLTTLVLDGAELGEVMAAVVDVLGGRLLAVDAERRVLSGAGEPQDDVDLAIAERGSLPEPALAAGLTAAFAEAEADMRTVVLQIDGRCVSRVIVPLPPRADTPGFLVLSSAEAAHGAQRLLERAAMVVAVLLLNARVLNEAEERVRGEFLEQLLRTGGGDDGALRRQAPLLGIDLEQPHSIVVAVPAQEGSRWMALRARRLAARLDGLATEIDGATAVLLPRVDAEDAARLVAEELGDASCPPTVTAAGPAVGCAALAGVFTEARDAQRLLTALGRSGAVTTAQQLGFFGLLLRHAQAQDVRAFVQRTLEPLVSHDEHRGGALVITLRAYFEHQGHLARTAAALQVHINTLYARLGRVDALLPEWRAPEQQLELQLAIKLSDVIEKLADER